MKHLVLLTSCLTLAVGVLAIASPALAQERIYRCGNEYTNQIKGRTGCKLVEGGNITVVRGTAPAKHEGGASGQRVVTAPASAPRVDAAEQRARDADAKAILEQELQRAQNKQAELVKDYNNGEPDKIGGEAKNYQKYLDRVADMKASIDRNQSDIDGIKRELERYK
jgi:hypothetical protein